MKMLLIFILALAADSVTGFSMFKSDNFSSPQTISPISLSYGDMALTPLQRIAFKQRKHSFNAIPDPTRRWKDAIIPYKIDCSLEHIQEALDAIHAAIEEWEKKTCIRFKKHTNEKYFLTFFRDTHCW